MWFSDREQLIAPTSLSDIFDIVYCTDTYMNFS